MLYIIPTFDYPISNFLFSAIQVNDTAFVTIEESFIGKVLRHLHIVRLGCFSSICLRVWRDAEVY